MRRRTLLSSLVAALVGRAAGAQSPLPAGGPTRAPDVSLTFGPPTSFSPDAVVARARALAASPHRPRPQVPQDWRDLTYDQYRSFWFPDRHALWEGTDVPLRVDLFPPGLYYTTGVDVAVVENHMARRVIFDARVFDRTDRMPALSDDPALGWSGLRLRAELEQPGIFTEFAVFQGASYLRAIGSGEIYGLSARGLAIDTAEPSGEEFPDFTAFWVEAPASTGAPSVVHALLDSPSVTGAYRFVVTPGEVTRMDVTASLFARNRLTHLGLAPLTSMFLFDETNRDRFSDYRSAVHDSDGLLMHNGADEVLWRPLGNPRALQISAFGDADPRGFGLMQRARAFGNFADLEALYHRRPGVWITPGEGWGRGSVTLVEIPTDLEVYDNVVAYWRPADAMEAGDERRMTYRMEWGDADPATRPVARVVDTRIGGHPDGGLIVAIDYADHAALPDDLADMVPSIRSTAGTATGGVVQRNPETGGPRVAFAFDPGEAALAELRVELHGPVGIVAETWLYRLTA